jgi:hypothetical protein
MILAVNASLRWLNNVLSLGFLLVSRVWNISLGIGTLFPLAQLAGGLCKLFANAGGKTNTPPTTLCAIEAASQSTFISPQLYSSCD